MKRFLLSLCCLGLFASEVWGDGPLPLPPEIRHYKLIKVLGYAVATTLNLSLLPAEISPANLKAFAFRQDTCYEAAEGELPCIDRIACVGTGTLGRIQPDAKILCGLQVYDHQIKSLVKNDEEPFQIVVTLSPDCEGGPQNCPLGPLSPLLTLKGLEFVLNLDHVIVGGYILGPLAGAEAPLPLPLPEEPPATPARAPATLPAQPATSPAETQPTPSPPAPDPNGGGGGAGGSGNHAPDTDGDGKPNSQDNCPAVANPLQENRDGDAAGDACDECDDAAGTLPNGCVDPNATTEPVCNHDTDLDCDGVNDDPDNCPATANPNQENQDGDLEGDACDDNPTTKSGGGSGASGGGGEGTTAPDRCTMQIAANKSYSLFGMILLVTGLLFGLRRRIL